MGKPTDLKVPRTPAKQEWVYLWEYTDNRGRRQVTRRPLTVEAARELLKDPVMVFGSGELRRSLLPGKGSKRRPR